MRNGYYGIARSIAIVVVIGLGFNLLGGLILVAFYGVNVKAGSPSVIILANAVAQLVVMLGAPLLIVRSVGRDFFQSFRLEGMSETTVPMHLLAIPIIGVGQFVGQGLASLWMTALSQFPDFYSSIQSFQKNIDDMMSGLTTANSPVEMTILLFGVAIVPAFVEESFFRGFIQTNIERSGKRRSRPIVALIITSVLFAAMHASPLEFPGLLTIGLLLGWISYRTCDLRVSILGHAFNNGAIVITAYFLRNDPEIVKGLTETTPMALGDTLVLLGLTTPILFGLLYVFQRMTASVQARGNADRLIEALSFTESPTQTTDSTHE